MEIEYKKFIPRTNTLKNLTHDQYEIAKRGQYLSRYFKVTNTTLYPDGQEWFPNIIQVYDSKNNPSNILKVFLLDDCQTRGDRFIVYKQLIDFIVSNFLQEDIFY
jgi:hypothetical protein